MEDMQNKNTTLALYLKTVNYNGHIKLRYKGDIYVWQKRR